MLRGARRADTRHMTIDTTCHRCASGDLLAVNLAPDGKPVTFHTCRRCEHRWWQDGAASSVALDEVLVALSR